MCLETQGLAERRGTALGSGKRRVGFSHTASDPLAKARRTDGEFSSFVKTGAAHSHSMHLRSHFCSAWCYPPEVNSGLRNVVGWVSICHWAQAPLTLKNGVGDPFSCHTFPALHPEPCSSSILEDSILALNEGGQFQSGTGGPSQGFGFRVPHSASWTS